MNKNKQEFLNTLDEMEMKMPKMSEEKIQRILKLELEKAGLSKKKKKKRPFIYKYATGLVAACLVLVVSFTAVKMFNPNNSAVTPIDTVPGTITSQGNPSGSITTQTDPIVNSQLNQYKSIEEAVNELTYTVSLPADLPQSYQQKTISVDNNIITVALTNNKTDIIIEALPSNELMSTSSVISANVININDLNITLKGENDSYILATWQHNEVNYSIYSSAGLSKEQITEIIKSLKEFQKK